MAPRGTSRRIAEELRGQIRDGSLRPGSMLPSESQLADVHEVARGTVRSALAHLVEDGLVEVVPGVGRKVVGSADGNEPTSAYARIAADLGERVRKGELGAGAQLPSETMLVEQYRVSRNTVRRAYRVLAESGLVVVRHGSGAFVRDAEG
ncbi:MULTISPECIES: GntR family transcriptional regulator [unclassified Pseudonocardia]|uniref:GntR family transcriptional regulator n=1 Tax=unclassified Pseudonocardia TaxID=2619320 RepID=UPI001930F0D0